MIRYIGCDSTMMSTLACMDSCYLRSLCKGAEVHVYANRMGVGSQKGPCNGAEIPVYVNTAVSILE